MASRTAKLSRQTSESSIELSLDLDGTGTSSIHTTVPFFDHLLTAFSKHSLVDLTVTASGAARRGARASSRGCLRPAVPRALG
jgi:imidazoleglycerol-phosphate dehydratase